MIHCGEIFFLLSLHVLPCHRCSQPQLLLKLWLAMSCQSADPSVARIASELSDPCGSFETFLTQSRHTSSNGFSHGQLYWNTSVLLTTLKLSQDHGRLPAVHISKHSCKNLQTCWTPRSTRETRGLWARPPVLTPVPVQAFHSRACLNLL